MKKIIIAAVAQNSVIGKADGSMPWHSREDFKHFQDTTYGWPIIMGRKTFFSLGKPLKGRINVIVTNSHFDMTNLNDVVVARSLEEAIAICEIRAPQVFIIGGGQIYKEALEKDFVDEMIISFMNFPAKGEIFFPDIDRDKWDIVERFKKPGFEIVHFERKMENVED